MTREVGVIGVTRLMRASTSKASFWISRLCSTGSAPASNSFRIDSGSPKRMWMLPYRRRRVRTDRSSQPKLSFSFARPICSAA